MTVQCSQWSECGVKGGGCCGLGLYGGKPSVGICVQICKSYDGPKVELPVSPPPTVEPIPRADWPPKILKYLRYQTPSDTGIGDIMARRYARWGGNIFKRVRKFIGWPCTCEMDQKNTNLKYPLDSNAPPL